MNKITENSAVNKYKIMLVNRDNSYLGHLKSSIKKFGVDCITAQNGLNPFDVVTSKHPDILVTDLIRPRKEGFHVLQKIKQFAPNTSVILLTSVASLNKAMAAVKAGAFDCVQKPLTPERFEFSIQKAISQKEQEEQNGSESSEIKTSDYSAFEKIIGKSPPMQEIFKKLTKICKSDANVMIYGETGTGKDLFARTIHAYSARSSEPFIPVDCVALPETLLESELFGYEKGAFTGAESMRRGLLEYADRGTLFLDEISELAPNLQAKLLRVLQEREFRRVGGKDFQRVDLRVISATNQEPTLAVESNRLREDLYYRLNVIPLELPPLRQRKEDIPLFVEYYLQHFGNSARYRKLSIDDKAMQALLKYNWPGNVRELCNLIECLVSLTDGPVIEFSDLPENITAANPRSVRKRESGNDEASQYTGLSFQKAKNQVVAEFERAYFSNILKKCEGNISQAARQANISRRTLYRMITNHDLGKLL